MQNKSGSLENCVCWIEFPPSNILKSHDDIENLPRNVDDDDPAHWDHALLLTGLDLYDRYKTQDAVIGLAWVSGMCHRDYSCTINEGNNYESVFVIAHEMGHK